MNWDDLRFALAVADSGSLTAAAEALEVNASTVLRRISALEKAVGVRLFVRGRAGYQLTEEGAGLVTALRPVQQRLAGIERGFGEDGAGTELRVQLAAPAAFAGYFLAPRLRQLRIEQPALLVELSTIRGLPPTALSNLDAALCYGAPVQGDMLTRKLSEIGYGLYGAAELLARRGRGPLDIARLPLIGFAHDEPASGPAEWMNGHCSAGSDVVFRSNDASCRLAAVQSAMGFACLPCFMADQLPGLTRIAGPDAVGHQELWLVTHWQAREVARIRLLVDSVVTLVQSRRERLRGIN